MLVDVENVENNFFFLSSVLMFSQIERQRPVRGADEQIALNQNVGIVNTHHDTYK